jgi:uncharacterized protein DUF2867
VPGVFDLMPAPDWAATTTIATGNAAGHTPEEWARAIFDPRTVPSWVGALFAVRQTAVKALGIPRGRRWMLAVSRVTSDDAIIDTDDRHLRFVAAVTAEPGFVHVTTAVTLKGWRGRVYFAPVRLLHDAVTRSMMAAAARRLAT